jgi:hypothetical protein
MVSGVLQTVPLSSVWFKPCCCSSNSAVGQCVCPGSQVGRGSPADLQRAARLHIINARSGGTHAGMNCSILDLNLEDCNPVKLASSVPHPNKESEWWQSAMPTALDSASSKFMR